MYIETFLFILTAIVTYWIYAIRNFKYWERKNVPTLEISPLFGSMENPFRRKHHLGVWFKKLYDEFRKNGAKHGGIFLFAKPAYLIVDPEMLKRIMQTDFQYFVDRGFYHNEKYDPISAHLFAIGGPKWRYLRTKLTPTFTSGKMKMMFDTLVQCGKQMEKAMDTYTESKKAIDIRNVGACFTTNVIGSCAFGLECNCFENPDGEFREYGKKVFEASYLQNLKIVLAFQKPELARKLGITAFPKSVINFFMNVVKETVNYRETNNFVRKDMLQLLIDMKKEDTVKNQKPLTMEEITAQAFVFFAAGFETSSTTMTFALYELASNPDIQQKLRNEINRVLDNHNGEITYDSIMEMKYMGQIVDETLRKYPPLAELTRECVKDYKIPDSDILIEKGTKIMIPVFGFHRDPQYFPDPEKFDPERFSEENKTSILPFTYIPFGEGPRTCIGLRFGMMQTKVGLTILIKNYKFSVNKKTPLPIKMKPNSFTLLTDGGIWLDAEKISK